MSWHDELMVTRRPEPLATNSIGRRLAAVNELLRSIARQTPKNSHSILKLDALRNIQPMELGVKQMCQAYKLAYLSAHSVTLPKTAKRLTVEVDLVDHVVKLGFSRVLSE